MNVRRRDPAYCFASLGKQRAPWRPTIQQARADALDAGFGSWGDHLPKPGAERRIFLDALGEIWSTHELVPAVPREVVEPSVRKEDVSDDYAGLSRIERIIARREGRMR